MIGGHITNTGTAGYIGQLTSGVKAVSPALRVSNELPLNGGAPASLPVYGQLGSANVGRTAIEIVSGDDPRPYRLIYNNSTTDTRTGWWEWNWANLSSASVLAFCHEKAKEWAEKMPNTAKAWLPRGVYLGMPNSRRTADNDGRVYVTAGAAPPTTGVWSRGDRVLNNSGTRSCDSGLRRMDMRAGEQCERSGRDLGPVRNNLTSLCCAWLRPSQSPPLRAMAMAAPVGTGKQACLSNRKAVRATMTAIDRVMVLREHPDEAMLSVLGSIPG